MTNEKDREEAREIARRSAFGDWNGAADEVARYRSLAVKAALARGRAEWFRDTSTITWSRIERAILEVDFNPPPSSAYASQAADKQAEKPDKEGHSVATANLHVATKALEDVKDVLHGEINTSNYTHEDVCKMSMAVTEAWGIAFTALTEINNSQLKYESFSTTEPKK